MAKLIAFYSRADENYFGRSVPLCKSATPKRLQMISDLTGADMFKIEQKFCIPQTTRNVLLSRLKTLNQRRDPTCFIAEKSSNDYSDEIYLGYPNYCGTMPMAVYTFLFSI